VPVWSALTTTYGINVATANAWATGRTIATTGDATGTSAAFTGAANLSFALTLATVNANVGAFGSVTSVPVITVNAKGLVTAVSTATLGNIATQAASSVAITGGSITNVTHGTGNTWSGTAIPITYGGTGGSTATGTGSVVLATSPTLVTPLLGTPTSGNFSTGTFTWPTFNQNTTGSSASCTGNAATAYGKAEGALSVLYAATSGTAGNITGVAAIANGGSGAASGKLTATISTNTAAVNGTTYTFAGVCVLTLAASPTVGNWVGFSNPTTATGASIDPNGKKIMNTTGVMYLDITAGSTLVYSGATYGWVLI
jgi:hypothetical protein